MKKLTLLFVGVLIPISWLYCQEELDGMSNMERQIIRQMDNRSEHYFTLAQKIWSWAELGYQEKKSSSLLQAELRNNGFEIQSGVAGIPTAFVATYGNSGPVIGILAEFDALPGVSQGAVPFRQPRSETENGHACGHHLFGAGSVAAAVMLKEWLVSNKVPGTIKLFGTPAEEGGAGKVYFVREGLFEKVDAVLHWHPSNGNSADAASSLANKSAKFRFYGNASHAAGSPWNGRSALDGVESMNFMVNLMREHIPTDSRIHYVITSGGEAPNVVPEFAEVFYYVRHPEMSQVAENFDWVVKIAEAAAAGTETKLEYEVIHGIYNVLPNATLSRLFHEKLSAIGGYKYSPAELDFAQKIINTFSYADNVSLETVRRVKPFQVIEKGQGGSTDVGDVSWMVPTVGIRTATWVPGTSAHSWQAVAAGGTTIGKKGMMLAAKTLTLGAITLFQDPEILLDSKAELIERRGDGFIYKSLLGDRQPPLHYRN